MGRQKQKGGGESSKQKHTRARRSPRLTLKNKVSRLESQATRAGVKIEVVRRRLAANKPVRGEKRWRKRHGVAEVGAFRLRTAKAQIGRLEAHIADCDARADKLDVRAATA